MKLRRRSVLTVRLRFLPVSLPPAPGWAWRPVKAPLSLKKLVYLDSQKAD